MKNYLLMWILLTLLLFAVLYLMLCGWGALPISSIMVLFAATAVTAVILANEMRRPMAKEYNRKKALYPKINATKLS